MPRRYEVPSEAVPSLPLRLGTALRHGYSVRDLRADLLAGVVATEGMPRDVLIYEIAGPLFFGAAQKAMSALQRVPTGIRVVVLDLSSVPAMDATGMVSLESTVARLH